MEYKINNKLVNCLENDVLLSHCYDSCDSFVKRIRCVARLILEVSFYNRSLQIKEEENKAILFFTSPNIVREDYATSYNNVKNLLMEKSEVCVIKKRELSFIRMIRLIPFSFKEFFKASGFNFGERSLVVKFKIRANDLYNTMLEQDFSNTKLAIVYNDLYVEEYTFIMYMKKNMNIKTATLQHGAFIASRKVNKPSIDFSGIELKNSRADYFLAWNQFTKDEAIKSGMNPDKVVILGIPKYINYKCDAKEKRNSNAFGIVLNGSGFGEFNAALIQCANYLAERTDKKFYLKYHPTYKSFIYDEFVNLDYFAGNLPINSTMAEYVDLVDFTLMSNSSVFIELVFLNHIIFRLHAGEYDKYLDIKNNVFTNENELWQLYFYQAENQKNDQFEYLCFTNKPEETYRDFFTRFN